MDNLSRAFQVTFNADDTEVVFKLDLRFFNGCCASSGGTTNLECFNVGRKTH